MNTGEIIKELRLKLGMSQEELGKKIGVQKAAINKYEKGLVVNLKRETIAKLADALETTPTILMGWDKDGLNQDFTGVEQMQLVPSEQSTRGMTPEEREAYYRGQHLDGKKEKPAEIGELSKDEIEYIKWLREAPDNVKEAVKLILKGNR